MGLVIRPQLLGLSNILLCIWSVELHSGDKAILRNPRWWSNSPSATGCVFSGACAGAAYSSVDSAAHAYDADDKTPTGCDMRDNPVYGWRLDSSFTGPAAGVPACGKCVGDFPAEFSNRGNRCITFRAGSRKTNQVCRMLGCRWLCAPLEITVDF